MLPASAGSISSSARRSEVPTLTSITFHVGTRALVVYPSPLLAVTHAGPLNSRWREVAGPNSRIAEGVVVPGRSEGW